MLNAHSNKEGEEGVRITLRFGLCPFFSFCYSAQTCYLHHSPQCIQGLVFPEQHLITNTDPREHICAVLVQHREQRIVLALVRYRILVDPDREYHLHGHLEYLDRLKDQGGLVAVHAIDADAVRDLGHEDDVVDDSLERGTTPGHERLGRVVHHAVEGLAQVGIWGKLGDGWGGLDRLRVFGITVV